MLCAYLPAAVAPLPLTMYRRSATHHPPSTLLVLQVYIPKDFYTGRPRGIAFVEVCSAVGAAGCCGSPDCLPPQASIAFKPSASTQDPPPLISYLPTPLLPYSTLQFDDRRDAEDAKNSLDRSMLGGSEVQVQYAMRGRRRPGEGGGRGGGGGYGGGALENGCTAGCMLQCCC